MTGAVTADQPSEAARDAIAHIAQGIQELRSATERDDAVRAREYTRALRHLVGAGPRRDDSAVWTRVLRVEREHAVRRLITAGEAIEDLAVLCGMTTERVRQIAGGAAGTRRRATGRPAGRAGSASIAASDSSSSSDSQERAA